MAEFTRRSLDARLRREHKGKDADPFAGITGLVAVAETDLVARVDEVLYR